MLSSHEGRSTFLIWQVLSSHEGRFANAVELGVRFGKTLVIQELDSIDSILVPLLRADLTRQVEPQITS